MLNWMMNQLKICFTCEQPLLINGSTIKSPDTTNICFYCQSKLPLLPFGTDITCTQANEALILTHVDGVCAALMYQWPVTKWVSGLKFGKHTEYATTMGYYMARQLEQQTWEFDYTCAVPLHPFRQWRRGYNQSEKLLEALTHSTKLSIQDKYKGYEPWIMSAHCYPFLKRRRYTKPQAMLNQPQRRENVERVFVCKQPILSGNVLLVDDVLTTGNTINQAAKALKNAGANKVYVVCAALKVLETKAHE